MTLHVVAILASLTFIVTVESAPIDPVKFIKINRRADSPTSAGKSSRRPARSYGEVTIDVSVWTDPTVPFLPIDVNPNSIAFNYEGNGHVSPDFSNGLEHHDPLLLNGVAANRAVRYLYSRELFFGDIPHVRAMLRNQEERQVNGLPGNRLGSLREHSPFYRYKKQRRLVNYL